MNYNYTNEERELINQGIVNRQEAHEKETQLDSAYKELMRKQRQANQPLTKEPYDTQRIRTCCSTD